MNLTHGKDKRKAISPVLATVILIAITLIAAIAIAGFVFGLFGSFTSTAQVSVSVTALQSGASPSGSLVAANVGTANVAINAITMTYGGQTCTPVISTAAPWTVTADSSILLTFGATSAGHCGTVAGTGPASGERFVGSLSLANGDSVQFTGTFQ